MPYSPDDRNGEARGRAVHADQAALLAFVLRRGLCDATGDPLDVRNAVAMTVTVEPGVSRLAVVTAAHWDGRHGALSSADPAADKDVLDGRRLFGDGPPPGALTRSARPQPQPSRAPLVQAPRRVPGAGGRVLRA